MGDDINEDSDIDKEIALFKMELKSKLDSKKEINARGIYNICIAELLPLFNHIIEKASVFNEFFFQKENWLNVIYTNIIENGRSNYSSGIDKRNDLMKYFQFFSNEAYKIESIYLGIRLFKFKDENNRFDVTGSLDIKFNSYDYEIRNHDLELNLMKLYNEKLTLQDKKMIETIILRDIKDLIQYNFKA